MEPDRRTLNASWCTVCRWFVDGQVTSATRWVSAWCSREVQWRLQNGLPHEAPAAVEKVHCLASWQAQRCNSLCASSAETERHTDTHTNIQTSKNINTVICLNTLVMSHITTDLPRQQWSLLNHFRTEQGQCSACRRKWRLTDTDLCPCGEIQMMSHIVKSCPLTKLNGSLSRLHSADEDAVSWLTNYGSWHAYKKNWCHTSLQAHCVDIWVAAATTNSAKHNILTTVAVSKYRIKYERMAAAL